MATNIIHRYQYCPKKEQERHSSVCQKNECGCLVVDVGGVVSCDFKPKTEKLNEQHKDKIKNKRRDGKS